MASKSKPCEWTTQQQAFAGFAGFTEKTQSAGHIRPLHWYVACRLVVEGGFHPDDIKPRPPFTIGSKRAGLPLLIFNEQSARGGEATVLGGLKTKNVDVVVTREGIGPGRNGIRDDMTRYESIGLGLVEAEPGRLGDIVATYPDPASGLNIDGFFDRLYTQYDERFIYGAPKLETVTRRLEWSPDSPALKCVTPDYPVRLGTPKD